MFKPMRTMHPVIKIINSSLVDLPAPVNISIWWNYGSLLGLSLMIQTITGLFLSMHYIPNIELAFISVAHINRDVNFGWLLRATHANGASMFFLFIYLHTGRGLYYNSYLLKETWTIGIMMLVLTMAAAFTGYVLPWGQMSFWGATVITNIFSAIPYIGQEVVEWLWGGFAVDNATLNRFFSFHFLIPFILMGLTGAHILFLHQTGSNNPIGVNSDSDRIPFHLYFSIKDMLGYVIVLFLVFSLVLFAPNLFTDPENFLNANPLITPIHIQPEWYFLWLYAILRSIPNKLGGVVALAMALVVIGLPPFTHFFSKVSYSFYPLAQLMFWMMISSWSILTWIGARPVESPYMLLGQIATIIFFSYFLLTPLLNIYWDKLIKPV